MTVEERKGAGRRKGDELHILLRTESGYNSYKDN